MAIGFKKATKQQAKLRAAFYGPSGAGKTFTALRVATGIGGPIGFIDSERGSASKYADRFDFDVLELEQHGVDDYVEAIRVAAKSGFNVLVIDSLSHAWEQLVEEVDRLARAKYKGNSWSAWSEGTPKQRELVDAILTFPGHVIATMRAKTEWSTEKNAGGKSAPTRVGLSPQMRAGTEYEFDLLVSISVDHVAIVEKDRTGKFQDKTFEKPDEDFGRELAGWLSDGAPATPRKSRADEAAELDSEKRLMLSLLADLEITEGKQAYVSELNGGEKPATLEEMRRVNGLLGEKVAIRKRAAEKEAVTE